MEELLHNFGVNWKLLLAQVVNFSILVYVLKRFAYGPVVGMLQERERRIKRGLEDSAEAERKLAEAAEKEDEILEGAREKAVAVVTGAEEVAYRKEAEIVDVAHRKAEQVLASAQRRIEEDRAKAGDEIRRDAAELVALASARVLSRLEPDERDKHLVKEALDELKAVSEKL